MKTYIFLTKSFFISYSCFREYNSHYGVLACVCKNVNAGTFLLLSREASRSLSTLWTWKLSLRAFIGSVHYTLCPTFSMINSGFVEFANPADFKKAVCCWGLNPGRIYWYTWVFAWSLVRGTRAAEGFGGSMKTLVCEHGMILQPTCTLIS